ncbi:DUF6665 family protein [Roseibium salinum]|uniref:Uncharacterized protein n=1 Tax=Roseibium salinum TaxID=1604349 RepID=A0ABT3QXK2_9HYPH|nr:DUF6665 family protein [Roseibium sp. DSM 29163]MCX2721671.1 hypothetical protein [Roseibium sp. DSM 29163]MDN3720282.1 hypothetical protein [Roseibium salinum]
MSIVRPPRSARDTDKDPLAAALEQEIFNEKAATLSRLNKKLETALARLKEAREEPGLPEDRLRHLQAQAGEALWHVTIQRELCGLRHHKAFYDFLAVPGEVRLLMGPAGSIAPAKVSRKT